MNELRKMSYSIYSFMREMKVSSSISLGDLCMSSATLRTCHNAQPHADHLIRFLHQQYMNLYAKRLLLSEMTSRIFAACHVEDVP